MYNGQVSINFLPDFFSTEGRRVFAVQKNGVLEIGVGESEGPIETLDVQKLFQSMSRPEGFYLSSVGQQCIVPFQRNGFGPFNSNMKRLGSKVLGKRKRGSEKPEKNKRQKNESIISRVLDHYGKKHPFLSIPQELIHKILSHLDASGIIKASRLSLRLAEGFLDDNVLKKVKERVLINSENLKPLAEADRKFLEFHKESVFSLDLSSMDSMTFQERLLDTIVPIFSRLQALKIPENLEKCVIYHCRRRKITVSREMMERLAAIKGLDSLFLDKVDFNSRVVEILASMKQLKHLSLCDTNITIWDVETLSRLASIELLMLDSLTFSDDRADLLPRFSSLTRLFLIDCNFSVLAFQRLAGMKRLTRLQISNKSPLSAEKLVFIRNLTNLKILKIEMLVDHFSEVEGAILELPCLEILEINVQFYQDSPKDPFL